MGFFGREVLSTNINAVDRTNVLEVLSAVGGSYNKNKKDIRALFDIRRGKQEILGRPKKVRPEINNKIVINLPHETVTFKTGFIFGEPIQYVSRGEKDRVNASETNEAVDDIVILNRQMARLGKYAQDLELADCVFACGVGYRVGEPNGKTGVFEFDTAAPDTTALVYNSGFGRRRVMSIQELEFEDRRELYIYTPRELITVHTDALLQNGVVVDAQPHVLGDIPVFEYLANTSRMGAFELGIPILNAINLVNSNRLDGIEQFIQGFLRGINVKIDMEKYEELLAKGMILFASDPGNPASLDYVTAELNQAQVQTYIDHLLEMYALVCDMPNRNAHNRSTSDTGQGVSLRDGWESAATSAKGTMALFEKPERQFLKMYLDINGAKNNLNIDVSDIAIKFACNTTDNILTKTQVLETLIRTGIHPQHAINTSKLFSDPNQVFIDSKPYIDALNEAEGQTEKS